MGKITPLCPIPKKILGSGATPQHRFCGKYDFSHRNYEHSLNSETSFSPKNRLLSEFLTRFSLPPASYFKSVRHTRKNVQRHRLYYGHFTVSIWKSRTMTIWILTHTSENPTNPRGTISKKVQPHWNEMTVPAWKSPGNHPTSIWQSRTMTIWDLTCMVFYLVYLVTLSLV